jgi:hypothetical protein
MKRTLGVQLFDNNLTVPVFQQNLESRVSGLKFGTKLNGGFSTCQFALRLNLGLTKEWVYNKYFYRIVVTDGFHTFWEGRIQDPEFDIGKPAITAYGYYASLLDQVYYGAYNTTWDAALKAIRAANCPSIANDDTKINAGALTCSTVANTMGTQYADATPQALAELFANTSDTTFQQWFLAVWENRVLWAWPKPTGTVTVTWRTSLKDCKTAHFAMATGGLYNITYGIYTSGGVLTRTAEFSDTTSQTKYGLTRKTATPQLGTVAVAAANAAARGLLATDKSIFPTNTNLMLGDHVYDANGVAYSSAWVRAGDIIQITDLLTADADIATPTLNGLNTFFIMETMYDADSMSNGLTIENQSTNLDAILGRKLSP